MQSVLANAEQALENVAEQSQMEAVNLLAEKFNFNVKEAKAFLHENGSTKSEKNTSRSGGKGKGKGKGKKMDKTHDDDVSVQVKAKRNPSGYMLYSEHIRPDVVKDLTEKLEDGMKLRGPDMMKALGARWKELSDTERNAWNTKAKTTTVEASNEE